MASPQILSLGKTALSIIVCGILCLESHIEAVTPPGPAPTIKISVDLMFCILKVVSRFQSKVQSYLATDFSESENRQSEGLKEMWRIL